MGRNRHTAEKIVAKLRQVDVLMAQGRPVADAVQSIWGAVMRPRCLLWVDAVEKGGVSAGNRRGAILMGWHLIDFCL